MTRLMLVFTLTSVFASGAMAMQPSLRGPQDDARYLAETAGNEATATTLRISTSAQVTQQDFTRPSGQHSLRDPYNDPAFLARDINR